MRREGLRWEVGEEEGAQVMGEWLGLTCPTCVVCVYVCVWLCSQVDLSHIFLTSSFDWTMKMWTSKLLSERQITVSFSCWVCCGGHSPAHLFICYQSKVGVPLCSLESNSEYIYDVQWSPVHPAVLASADGEGKIDIWNLNLDSEVRHRDSEMRHKSRTW